MLNTWDESPGIIVKVTFSGVMQVVQSLASGSY
jgi:hypothetical protein